MGSDAAVCDPHGWEERSCCGGTAAGEANASLWRHTALPPKQRRNPAERMGACDDGKQQLPNRGHRGDNR